MKKISFKLGSAEIDRAIKELKEYQTNIEDKVAEFVDRLIQEGMNVAKVRLASTKGDSTNASLDSVYINSTGEVIKAVIYLEGNDVLFVEFGAGIAYNTGAQHPLAGEFGYGPGTYPSKHPPNKGINPGRWIYGHNDDGSPLWSIGTEATMPVYGAAEAMRNKIVEAAKAVFRSK